MSVFCKEFEQHVALSVPDEKMEALLGTDSVSTFINGSEDFPFCLKTISLQDGDESAQRRVVSSVPIRTGDLLFEENPYEWAVLKEFRSTGK